MELKTRLNGVFFNDENTGFVVGDDGTLLKTTNGGYNWEPISLGNQHWLTDIGFYNNEIGFIISYGSIYKTMDSGNSWLLKISGLGFLSGISIVSENVVYVSGSQGEILKTTDGGENWEFQVTGVNTDLDDISFIDDLNGVACGGGAIIITSDGGNTWNNNPFNHHFFDVEHLNNNTIIATTGINWMTNTSSILRSTNSGVSWTSIENPAYYPLKDVSFSNNLCIAVGNYGTVVSSLDLGNTWAVKSTSVTQTNESFYDVSFKDHLNGFAVGSFGKICRTTDAGENWFELYTGTVTGFNEIYSINDLVVAVGWNGLVYRSIDFGSNWDSLANFTSETLFDVFFINETTGWIVGLNGKIFKTTDAGLNWAEQSSNVSNALFAVDFINADLGLCSGELGKIIRTTDGGNTWELIQTGLSFELIYDIQMINENLAYASCSAGIVLQTTDGGQSWNAFNTGVNKELSDIDFISESIGIAVGTQGTILRTDNGGVNWSVQNSFTNQNLESICFIDENSATAVGWAGTILHTANGGVTFIEDEENDFTQPKEFLLQQNYPNPFNPNTSIQYAISSTQFVTLKVYDLLGREVATLVNEEKPAGSYNAQFTINNVQLSSGIYFLQASSRRIC